MDTTTPDLEADWEKTGITDPRHRAFVFGLFEAGPEFAEILHSTYANTQRLAADAEEKVRAGDQMAALAAVEEVATRLALLEHEVALVRRACDVIEARKASNADPANAPEIDTTHELGARDAEMEGAGR